MAKDLITRRRTYPTGTAAPSRQAAAHEAVLARYAQHINASKVALLRAMQLDIVETARSGVEVTDIEGRRYIDCFGSSGCFNVGRRHPAVVGALLAAVTDEGLDIGDTAFLSAARADLAARLAEITPGDLDGAVFSTGGGEAVDFALKLARGYTQRPGIVCMDNAYHGHTGFALSATGADLYQAPFMPLVPGFRRVPFGDLDATAEAITEEVAAVIVEPVQGEGGINIPPDGYLPGLRQLCDERGTLLILDEIQTGLGRTGRMFACQRWDTVPDIMTIGKSLGGGLYPISATLFSPAVRSFVEENPFVHFSTFGGADLGCRVALAVIDEVVGGDLPQRAELLGERFGVALRRLQKEHPHLLVDVRQIGLMIGLECADMSLGPRVSAELVRRGVLAMPTGNVLSVIRLMPPLTISETEVDRVVDALEGAMAAL